VSRPILEVRGLRIAVFDEFVANTPGPAPNLFVEHTNEELKRGWLLGVDAVDLDVHPGEVVAVVGESGSGKSLTVMGAFDLLSPGARVLAGEVRLDGDTIFPLPLVPRRASGWRRTTKRNKADDTDWRRVVGTKVGFLFQDAIGALSPVELIGDQSGEVLEEHTDLTHEEIEERVFDALGEVRLPKVHKFFSFAHEMSRGEAQRAMLAAALLKAPRLLIADEPLSGLDASVAAAVLDLMRDLQKKRAMAMVIITHDLATVASIADRVAVVYGGQIVELGPVQQIFKNPRHPYTDGLLGSIPWANSDRLRPIPGEVPRLVDVRRDQCAFAPRCGFATEVCRSGRPALEPHGTGSVACVHHTTLSLPGVGG
jgi:oligopeptide/dipeptide ABC transporter ATP-binding protein